MRILAIETSCDETAIAIVEVKKPARNASGIADASGEGKKARLDSARQAKFKILGNEVSSQIDIHKEYGGVFPALAKREHIKNLPLVLEKVLKQAKIKEENIKKEIDAIAVTTGPGLEPALWTGIVFAKELSHKYKIPVVPVNHMEGHIFSIFPKKGKTFTVENSKELFPMLTLLVSGGHTELVLAKDWMKYKKLGQTRDDAAGEAFDKVARMLSLPYPGGPQISKLANEERRYVLSGSLAQSDGSSREKIQQDFIRADGKNISSDDIIFPRPMIYTKDYDFSFSGLKTAVLYILRDIGELTDEIKKKIACEFENAVVETLVHKTVKAIKEYKIKTLIVGGGVSANTYLQEQMKAKIKKEKLKVKVHFPSKALTGDNALMIAIAGYYQYQNKKHTTRLGTIKAKGNLSL